MRQPAAVPPAVPPADRPFADDAQTMFVVTDECRFSDDMGRGIITIQSVNPEFPRGIEELQGMASRNLATKYAAARGMGNPAINGSAIGPYPVNEDGLGLEKVADAQGRALPPQHPKMQPNAYRIDVPVCRRF